MRILQAYVHVASLSPLLLLWCLCLHSVQAALLIPDWPGRGNVDEAIYNLVPFRMKITFSPDTTVTTFNPTKNAKALFPSNTTTVSHHEEVTDAVFVSFSNAMEDLLGPSFYGLDKFEHFDWFSWDWTFAYADNWLLYDSGLIHATFEYNETSPAVYDHDQGEVRNIQMDLLQNTATLSSFLESRFSAPVESLDIDTCVLTGLAYQLLMTTATVPRGEETQLSAIQATLETSLSTDLQETFDNRTTVVVFQSWFSSPIRGENLTDWIQAYGIERICFSTVPPPVQDHNGRLRSKIRKWANIPNIQAALDANPDTQGVALSEIKYVGGSSDDLSTGAIVGIVIACVVVVLELALRLVGAYKHYHRRQRAAGQAATIGIEADSMQPDSLEPTATKPDIVVAEEGGVQESLEEVALTPD
jgi:hypothetical protein